MYDALRKEGIKATLILDSAVGYMVFVVFFDPSGRSISDKQLRLSYLMERIDMVVVGAEGVMETGGIINKVQFKSFFFPNVPNLSFLLLSEFENEVMIESHTNLYVNQ